MTAPLNVRISTLVFALITIGLCTTKSEAQTVPLGKHSPVPIFGSAHIVANNWARMDGLVDGNLDGTMDAVGVWTSAKNLAKGEFKFLANDGSGKMTETTLLTEIAIRGNQPFHGIVIGDWDGDGNDDFMLNRYDGQFSYFLSRKGKPVFKVTGNIAPSGAITSAVAADFDGERGDDVAVLTTSHLYLFLNRSGIPAVVGHIRVGGGFDLRVLDLDKDGRPDLLYTDTAKREIRMLKVNRSSGWNGPRKGAVTDYAKFKIPGTDAFHVATGDHNKDGDDDVAVFRTGGKCQTIDQITAGKFQGTNWYEGGPATALADIDGDGDLDGICCGGGGGNTQGRPNTRPARYEISLNDSGKFRPSVAIPNVGAQQIAGAADMNGDGRVDLVAGRGILFNAKGFGEATTWLSGDAKRKLTSYTMTGDYDGDGDRDYLVDRTTVARNRGDGRVALLDLKMPAPPTGIRYGSLGYFHGDWDGDGDIDLLVQSTDLSNGKMVGMRQLLCVDGVTFTDAGSITPAADSLMPKTIFSGTRTFVVDLDNNGLDDIVTANVSLKHSMRTFLNQGQGKFKELTQTQQLDLQQLTDLDGDGYPDFVVRNFFVFNGRGGVSIYKGQKNGQLGARTDFLTKFSFQEVMVTDYEGDGDLDVFAKEGTTLLLFINSGTGTFTKIVVATNLLRVPFKVRDFDGDGRMDVAVLQSLAQIPSVFVFTSPKAGKFEWRRQVVPDGTMAEFEDLDGDGDIDLGGRNFLANVTNHGPSGGGTEQFGVSRTGTRNILPLLGATGPFRPGEVSSLRLSGGMSNSFALIVAGVKRVDLINFPWSGTNTYVAPQPVQIVVPLDSTGRWSTAVRLTTAVANSKILMQAYVLDPTAPVGLTSTNGVVVRYGN